MTTRSLFWLVIANKVCHHKCIISPSICITLCVIWHFFYPVIWYGMNFLRQFAINFSLVYSNFSVVKNVVMSLFTLSSRAFATQVAAYTQSKLLKLLYHFSMPQQKSSLYIIMVSSNLASMEVRLSALYFLGLVAVLKYCHTCHLPCLHIEASGTLEPVALWYSFGYEQDQNVKFLIFHLLIGCFMENDVRYNWSL